MILFNYKTKNIAQTARQLLLLLAVMMLLLGDLYATDYKIDLRKISYPVLKHDFRMGNPGPANQEIKVNSLYMTIGGEPVLPVMGEFHYSRYDHRYWKETLLKMKASGITIVSTYALWIYHEEIEGRMNWTGNNNLRKFIQLCDEVGLLVHLRFGPYCNAECRNGGLPDWLMQKTYIRKRYNDPLYLAYTRRWYQAVFRQVEGLLYKDGGPVMGLQLENEYVTKGHVVPHLMELKKIAIEEGFDVPVYSMTHWMASDYPKKEIIPYAGYYIETPWTRGTDELPVSNFQFFSYNRLSDNIGTDLIQLDGEVQSLNSQELESPYFTCEVGLGTPSFYHRRPIVPEEMAGANINLRLGCGVNLMGYYMYSGGSNQVGRLTTLESSTSRVSYDYQAPLREFGQIGAVMNETKKYNYFMNDFGSDLAKQIAYLPASNDNTDNLQWAVRTDGNQGYLFCSNYLYKRSRKNFENVQFEVKLKKETLKIPRTAVTIKDGAYFMWPFNLEMGQIQLKYATVQPIAKLHNGKDRLWAFFGDDAIPAEYFFSADGIKNIKATNGKVKKEANGYFVTDLNPGTDCLIEIEQKEGSVIKVLTLTEEQSDKVWKFKNTKTEYLAVTESGVFIEDGQLTLFAEANQQQVLIYPELSVNQPTDGIFEVHEFEKDVLSLPVKAVVYRPMEKSNWIESVNNTGKSIFTKILDTRSLAEVKEATLRCAASQPVSVFLNEVLIELKQNGNYWMADLSGIFNNAANDIRIESENPGLQFIGEVESFMKNGSRLHWATDQTWESVGENRLPVKILGRQGENGLPAFKWRKDDGLDYYEIKLPTDIQFGEEELRLAILFRGDRADAYLGEQLISDYLFDGTDWVIGINRSQDRLQDNPLLLRAKAFDTASPDIYFEKYVDKTGLDQAAITTTELHPEYRFKLNLKN